MACAARRPSVHADGRGASFGVAVTERLHFQGSQRAAEKARRALYLQGQVRAEKPGKNPLVVVLVRLPGGRGDARANWELADHYVLEGAGAGSSARPPVPTHWPRSRIAMPTWFMNPVSRHWRWRRIRPSPARLLRLSRIWNW